MKDCMGNGWQTVKIGDVCDLKTGGTPSRTKPEYFLGDIKWLVSGDIHRRKITDCEGRISELGMANSNANPLPVGSVIIALNGQGKTRGTVAMLRTEATCNQSLVSIMPRDTNSLLPEFVFMNLHGRYDEIRRMTGDAGNERRGLNMRLIRGIEIPLPPLKEQQRIVAVLDEAFEGLARAHAHAQANLQNARELFENALEFELEGADVDQNTTLGEHIELSVGFAFKSKGYVDSPDGIRLMRGDNIIPGRVRWEGAKRWSADDVEAYERYQLAANDVLIAMDRTWIKSGIKYAVLSEEDVPSLLVQRVACLRPKQSLSVEFLAALIGSRAFERYVLSIQTGTGVPHISGTQIKDFPFFLPNINSQQRIASLLGELRCHTDGLTQRYDNDLQDLDDLRQSLLQKAFSGDLI